MSIQMSIHRLLLVMVVAGAGVSSACGDDDPAAPGGSDPLLEALEARFTFEGDANDVSGNGHHGTLLGGATVTGGALVTGSNDVDALSIPEVVMDGADAFTISGWVKMSTFHVFPSQWISLASAAESNNLGLYYGSAADRWGLDILGDRQDFATNSAMEDNDFHHVVLTRTGATASLYVDGAFVGSLTVPSGAIDVDVGGFIIGQDQDELGGGFSTDNSMAGELDELRVYRRTLDAGDVESLFQLGR